VCPRTFATGLSSRRLTTLPSPFIHAIEGHHRYFEQSLAIRREIGDKAGLVATLHNMGHIAWQADNLEHAMTLWSEAFSIAMETRNAQGIFQTASTLGQVLASVGAPAQARRCCNWRLRWGRPLAFQTCRRSKPCCTVYQRQRREVPQGGGGCKRPMAV
jgi:hypothetical protein